MKYITLNDIKAHCRIDLDAEDILLNLYGEAAEETVSATTDRKKASRIFP